MPLKVLVHPLARGIDIDSSVATSVRRKIIQRKRFLQKVYQEWYGHIMAELVTGPGKVLEIGTGAGFLSTYIPDLITSDVFQVPDLNLILDSRWLPFPSLSLRAIVMTEVLHHIPDAGLFFEEAARCVRPGGRIIMIEPWNSTWSRWVYKHLHYEPYDADSPEWGFPCAGPLSGANGALPWIMFERDREKFVQEYPQWHILSIRRMMPFRYLVSGGLTYRSLMPGWTFPLWRVFENTLQPLSKHLAMFACIVLQRGEDEGTASYQAQSSAATFSS